LSGAGIAALHLDHVVVAEAVELVGGHAGLARAAPMKSSTSGGQAAGQRASPAMFWAGS
jgi:hypothetical protein